MNTVKRPPCTRREFLAKSAAGLVGAVATRSAIGAPGEAVSSGERTPIRCAFIGVGHRGGSLLQDVLGMKDVHVVAMADTYEVWRSRAIGWCRNSGAKVKGYSDFEKLLKKEDVDAVVIAAPDHIHAPAATACVDAGVDVYLESPLALTWDQAKAVRTRAKEKSVVVQMGVQCRSTDLYQRAREIVKGGMIGKLLSVQVDHHVSWGALADFAAPKEASESSIDWKLFLRDTTPYPFDPVRYFQWRHFVEYSNGPATCLMLPHLDACHYVTGCDMPKRAMCVGGTYMHNDGRTCPDTMSAILEYPESFQFVFTCNTVNDHFGTEARYIGSSGILHIKNMTEMTLVEKDIHDVIKSGGPNTVAHLRGFFDSVRTRETTVANVDGGFMAATCCQMAVLSQQTGKAVTWDAEKEEVLS